MIILIYFRTELVNTVCRSLLIWSSFGRSSESILLPRLSGRFFACPVPVQLVLTVSTQDGIISIPNEPSRILIQGVGWVIYPIHPQGTSFLRSCENCLTLSGLCPWHGIRQHSFRASKQRRSLSNAAACSQKAEDLSK